MPARAGSGRTPFVPNPDQRLLVEVMTAGGFTQDVIASQVIHRDSEKIRPISVRTLQRKFGVEIEHGAATLLAKVTKSIYQKAMGDGPQSVTACIFILKCKAGWKEVIINEHTGKDGAPIATTSVVTTMTKDEFAQALREAEDAV